MKKLVIIIAIFSFGFINFAYAKYCEKYTVLYRTKIARPVFIVDNEEKKIIDDFENTVIEEYRIIIKNYDELGVNEIEIFYTFEIEGLVEGIDYEFKNVTQNEVLDFKENKSKEYKLGLNKQYCEYKLVLNFSNSIPKENTNINIVIKTRV